MRAGIISWTVVAAFLIACPVPPLHSETSSPSTLGSQTCAQCHKAIAATQSQTAMAHTWQAVAPSRPPVSTPQSISEGPEPALHFLLEQRADRLNYGVELPGRTPLRLPVEVPMAGTRHGLSFLTRVSDLDGLALPRAPLVEMRYLYYAPEHRLERSPGFEPEKPAGYDHALGRVLTPGFEQKCLACHGQPRAARHYDTGITCESCHGGGGNHLANLAGKPGQRGILQPAVLPVAEQMTSCAQCHAGFSKVVDPVPDDLLISDQVTALSNSECWRQSAGRITCVNCHNPHQDLPRAQLIRASERTCLGCHSIAAKSRAALCPVNRQDDCVSCHMPNSKRSAPFVISDHWIRVHPAQNVAVRAHRPEWRSQVTPRRLVLRLLATDNAQQADDLHARLAAGASFFDLARSSSIDRASAAEGGYLGDLRADQLDPGWAAAALRLAPGEVSPVVAANGRYVLLERLPRDYRERAQAQFDRAMQLRRANDATGVATALLEALKIYPRFLRALTYLGINYAERGNVSTGAGILRIATGFYPEDAGAHFNLGIADGAMSDPNEIPEYQRALAIDPDYVPAYLNWGAALTAQGRLAEAEQKYREGIRINPLVASLHSSLSAVLDRQGKTQDAQAETALAAKIGGSPTSSQ